MSVGQGGAQANGDSGFAGLAISGDGRFVAFASDASNLVKGDTNGVTDVFVYDRQAGTTERVSVGQGGAQAGSRSVSPSISGDGRYGRLRVVAAKLVPGDTNARADVFVRDRQQGTTERVSVGPGGTQGDQRSGAPSISADGRLVAFEFARHRLRPARRERQPAGRLRPRSLIPAHHRPRGRGGSPAPSPS